MAAQQQAAGSGRSPGSGRSLRSGRSSRNINWLWWVANALAAWPLVLMVWEYYQGTLGVDIVNAVNNRTGRTAVILLMASLACTPLNILFGWRQVLTVRKSLGLWAVAYALLHLLNFLGLDYAFNVEQIFQDAILSKPYILAGLASLLLLLPLAVTSTRGWMRRLGRNWKRLHRLAYAAGVLAVLHFLWQAKAAERWEPLLYAIVLGLLLFVRMPSIRQAIVRVRSSLSRHDAAGISVVKDTGPSKRARHTARSTAVQHPSSPTES
jgi:methionine sulfoxide reductase heme-binding subunit